MERLVGIPIEIALNGMPGLEDLRSTSIAGLTDVKCQFTYETDYWKARQEVINRMNSLSNLPAGVNPMLSPWSPTGEIVRYVLEGHGYTLNEIKAVQDWVVERALKTVPGVIDVTGFGGTVKQYLVLVDPMELNHYSITLQQVQDAIQKSNANVSGNILTLGSQSHIVRGIGLLGKGVDPLEPVNSPKRAELVDNKLDDIRNVVVAQYAGNPILVSHVAKVLEGHQPRLGIVGRHLSTSKENDIVEGIVLMRKFEKSIIVSDAVKRKIIEIQEQGILPPGMKITIFNERSELVNVTKHNVLHNLVVGMGLVIAILFIFLGDIASAAIVGIMIPLALLFSITVLYAQGKSANLLSIGAVDFGIIVDSSTIIVENIYRHITAPGVDRSRSLIDRIIDASSEIERALFYSTTIIVCAFIPLFSMSGPEGALFGPMANTYAFAICGALLMAVTLAPVLCSFLFVNKKEAPDTFLDRLMKLRYLKALSWVLRHRILTLSVMIALFVYTLFLIPHLGGEFMPPLEEGYLWIRATLPRTTSMEAAAKLAPQLREVVASIPEVSRVISQVGRPDDGTDVTGFFNLEMGAPLKPMEEWRKKPVQLFGYKLWESPISREDIEKELMKKFAAYPGINFNFSQYIRDNVEEALSGVKGANSVKIVGSNLETLEKLGQRIALILKTVPGIENVGLFHIVGQPNLEIEIDRQLCARHGVNVYDVERVVQAAIGGEAFTQMVEGEKLFDITMRLPPELRDDPEVINRILVDVPAADSSSAGYRIPLSQLTHMVAHKPGASYVYRENNRRFIPIKFSVRDRDLASAIAEAMSQGRRPQDGRPPAPGLRAEMVRRVRADAGGQRPPARHHPRLACFDLDALVFDVLLDQGLPAGHGERPRSSHGRRLRALFHRHPFQHLGRRRVRVGLRRRRPGRRPSRHLLQPDARPRLLRLGNLHARPRAPGAPRRHDLLDRGPRPLPRRHRDLDRLPGPETARNRRCRCHALHPLPHPLHDANPLQLLPRPPRPPDRRRRAPRRRHQLRRPLYARLPRGSLSPPDPLERPNILHARQIAGVLPDRDLPDRTPHDLPAPRLGQFTHESHILGRKRLPKRLSNAVS